MTTKHTEGPWESTSEMIQVGYDNSNDPEMFYVSWIRPFLDEFDEYRGDICSLQSAQHIEGISKAEAEANAHLIAAAPELLAALEMVIGDYEGLERVVLKLIETLDMDLGDFAMDLADMRRITKTCHAAIDKARSES